MQAFVVSVLKTMNLVCIGVWKHFLTVVYSRSPFPNRFDKEVEFMNPDSHIQHDEDQSHSSTETSGAVESDMLLKRVQRSQQAFRKLIRRRDLVEISVALLMIPVWVVMGVTLKLPWTWYLTIPALFWILCFFLVDRKLNWQIPRDAGKSLLESIQESLSQVEHQIWLLRNVFWWYLLPPSISILAFFAQVSWSLGSESGLFAIIFFAVLALFLFVVYFLVYSANQIAVRTQLEPRRLELATLQTDLQNQRLGDLSGRFPIILGESAG